MSEMHSFFENGALSACFTVFLLFFYNLSHSWRLQNVVITSEGGDGRHIVCLFFSPSLWLIGLFGLSNYQAGYWILHLYIFLSSHHVLGMAWGISTPDSGKRNFLDPDLDSDWGSDLFYDWGLECGPDLDFSRFVSGLLRLSYFLGGGGGVWDHWSHLVSGVWHATLPSVGFIPFHEVPKQYSVIPATY